MEQSGVNCNMQDGCVPDWNVNVQFFYCCGSMVLQRTRPTAIRLWRRRSYSKLCQSISASSDFTWRNVIQCKYVHPLTSYYIVWWLVCNPRCFQVSEVRSTYSVGGGPCVTKPQVSRPRISIWIFKDSEFYNALYLVPFIKLHRIHYLNW